MIYRRFGRTGLELSVFSCGGMRAQQSWSRAAAVSAGSQRNLEATVARALALGINHFETARGYGTSEGQFGRALAVQSRQAFILQTKLRPHDDAKVFESQLEESFAMLGVSVVDLVAVHGVNTPRDAAQTVRSGGCLEVLERFRRAGRVRGIGFSTHAPTPLILDLIATDRFDYVNLHYYYIFQDNRPALDAARARDMGVFIISPSDKGGRLYQAPETLQRLCAPLSPMAFNDLWCLAHPQIHTLSIGASGPSDFDAHVQALEHLDGVATLLRPIVARLERAYADALGEDFATRWHQGLREWDELPGQVNVKRILWLYNLVRAYDLHAFARERYATMSPDDAWVPGARAAHIDDIALTEALPDAPFRERIPALLREAHALLSDPDARPMP